MQARCDVNARDNDGWTPLHGAAHWGQIEACKLLVENFCDMDIKNYAVSYEYTIFLQLPQRKIFKKFLKFQL